MLTPAIIVAVLCWTSNAVAYQWKTSCTGEYMYGQTSECFSPPGLPTLADTIEFPASSSVSFNQGTMDSPYTAMMAQNIYIDVGAEVTLFNGMMAVQENVFVNGTLNLFSNNGMGAGPYDDGTEHPLPDYQLPGFTPTIIGKNDHFSSKPSNTGSQSKIFVQGTLVMGGRYYTSSFVDIVVELEGNFTVASSSPAYLFGEIKNKGYFSCSILYLAGAFVNDVSGIAYIGMQYNSPLSNNVWPTIINNGHIKYSYYLHDELAVNLINNGHFIVDEDPQRAVPHASKLLGETVIRGSLKNFGEMLFNTQRIRNNRFNFSATLQNSGKIVVRNAGVVLERDFDNLGVFHVESSHTESDWLTFSGPVRNRGQLRVEKIGATCESEFSNNGLVAVDNKHFIAMKAFTNDGTVSIQAQHVQFRGEARNRKVFSVNGQPGSSHVHFERTLENSNEGSVTIAASHAVFDDDVVNSGNFAIQAGHTSMKSDLYNEGHLESTFDKPRHSLGYVEGRTFNTGNISLRNTHFTVTSMLSHGDSHIKFGTAASTLTLGTWGSSMQRGVNRGYLRRERAEECTSEVQTHEAPAVKSDECSGMSSCEACCKDSTLCILYFENVYCGGYLDGSLFDPAPKGKEHYVLTALGMSKMPSKMKPFFQEAKIHHPHLVVGTVHVSGPGAVATTDTLEVFGQLFIEDGAEMFSMVEQQKNIVSGGGRIHVQRCGQWIMGNDARQVASPTPEITIREGGALVIPRHSLVTLHAGSVHIQDDGRLHVDGDLRTGQDFQWREAPNHAGRGKLTRE